MKTEHRLAAIVALLPVLALGAWRMVPNSPEDVEPCRNPVGVKLDGRIIAVCLGGATEMPLERVLARVGIDRCSDRDDVVETGQLVTPSTHDSCAAAIEPLPARAALILGLRVDINRADEEELQALPRIGPKKARWIVNDRKRRGRYRRLDELERVRGIGPKTVELLRSLVKIE